MNKFTQHSGVIACLDKSNVDTDAIMPKQYLKCIFKMGYGDWAFDDWRYLDKGDVETDTSTRRINPGFELNQPKFKDASVLLSRENFGCGSSREHAVWGIRDMGFKAIIATSFADIFYNNCFNNGLLAICLPEDIIQDLFDWQNSNEDSKSITIDLENLEIQRHGFESINFTMSENRRQRLLQGLDGVGETLLKSDKIIQFEQSHKISHPYYFNIMR